MSRTGFPVDQRDTIRRALKELGPQIPRVAIPEDIRPDLYVTTPPARTPMRQPEDHMRVYVDGAEIFGAAATQDELIELVRPIPHGWLIWMCSVLEHFMHRDDPYSLKRQTELLEELLSDDLRERVRPLVAAGRILVNEEQLLAVERLAIEHASDEDRDPTAEERSRFGDVLLKINDLIGQESPGADGGIDDFTAFGLRSLAFQSSQVFWHLIARGYSYWIRIPPLLAGSAKHQDIGALFEAAAGAPLDAFYTASAMTFIHGEMLVSGSDRDRWKGWTFNPNTLVAAPEDPAGLSKAWQVLSADRSELRALFAARPTTPRYVGAAMVPIRQRPIFRFANGNMVALSSRYVVEGLTSGIFWRIADHLRGADRARRKFTDFAGEIHERHVLELMRSAYDWSDHRRVVSDEEAKPKTEGDAPGSADALAFLGDHHVFAEATITGFRYDQTILPGDLPSFDDDIRRSVVKKAKQLEDAIADYRVGRMRYGDFSSPSERERRIWPVLVLRDPLPTFKLLTDRIERLLREGGVGKVDPAVFVLSVEELELALRQHDDGRLRALLGAWRAHPAYRLESFRNYYLDKHAAERDSVPYLKECYDLAFELLREQMGFPDRSTGP